MRSAEIVRKTAETDISLSINIDGRGNADISTGCGFLDHMLVLFAKHSKFDIALKCKGDTFVDYHHTAEDVGICLGMAVASALSDKKGIVRYASTILPMDESLIMSAVDISGRSYLSYDVAVPTEKVGDFDTELCEEFWLAFVRNALITLHIKKLSGSNSHHIIEGVFKSCARTMRYACAIDKEFSEEVPSSKGVL